jgi:GT2 family glycosyltransferase
MDLASELTVCICTRDRPDELERAIGSIVSSAPDATVVVSDDGDVSAAEIAKRFPQCRWQPGPAQGLGANRNAAVRSANTAWILFLDDDARLGSGFIVAMASFLEKLDAGERRRTIVTGRERNNGALVSPSDVDFLGFQRRAYEPGDPLHTVVINATIWPGELFDGVTFDEQLRYGSDEVDLSYAALAAGYRIESCPDAINDHHPSPSARRGYSINTHVSRLRASMKRNWLVRRSVTRTVAYAVVAPTHLLLALLRQEGIRGFASYASILKRWILDAR